MSRFLWAIGQIFCRDREKSDSNRVVATPGQAQAELARTVAVSLQTHTPKKPRLERGLEGCGVYHNVCRKRTGLPVYRLIPDHCDHTHRLPHSADLGKQKVFDQLTS